MRMAAAPYFNMGATYVHHIIYPFYLGMYTNLHTCSVHLHTCCPCYVGAHCNIFEHRGLLNAHQLRVGGSPSQGLRPTANLATYVATLHGIGIGDQGWMEPRASDGWGMSCWCWIVLRPLPPSLPLFSSLLSNFFTHGELSISHIRFLRFLCTS